MLPKYYENFNADTARKLTTSLDEKELISVLGKIEDEAQKLKDSTYIYTPLKEVTLRELEKRGFKIVKTSGIAIQRDGFYYTITW